MRWRAVTMRSLPSCRHLPCPALHRSSRNMVCRARSKSVESWSTSKRRELQTRSALALAEHDPQPSDRGWCRCAFTCSRTTRSSRRSCGSCRRSSSATSSVATRRCTSTHSTQHAHARVHAHTRHLHACARMQVRKHARACMHVQEARVPCGGRGVAVRPRICLRVGAE